jgi:hypothetical protein
MDFQWERYSDFNLKEEVVQGASPDEARKNGKYVLVLTF